MRTPEGLLQDILSELKSIERMATRLLVIHTPVHPSAKDMTNWEPDEDPLD